MQSPILSLRDVEKSFGHIEAVKGVTLDIEPGKIYCLIGPNGSGKTTLVRMIAGLLRPGKGTISLNGTDVVKDPVAAKAQLGYVPDDPTIWAGMTGLEFLHFTGAMYGMDERTRNEKIPGLLDIFHLDEIKDGRFDQYSRGNRQKFSILAAFIHSPKLLLVDEPIVGLDPVSARVAIEQFSRFAKEGGSILLVTHTLTAAESLANTIGFIEKGTLKAHGSLSELRSQAKVAHDATLEDVYTALL